VRYLVTAAMAASAIGLMIEPAVSLPLAGKAGASDGTIRKVQQQEKGGDRGKYGYGPGKLRRGGSFYFSGPNYGDVPSCRSLRRRALETGSQYWWRRYQSCRGGLGG
jgi:hypothetical protein